MIQLARTQTPDETEVMVRKRMEEINGAVERIVVEEMRRQSRTTLKDKKSAKCVWWLDEFAATGASERCEKQGEDEDATTGHEVVSVVGVPMTEEMVEYQTYLPTPTIGLTTEHPTSIENIVAIPERTSAVDISTTPSKPAIDENSVVESSSGTPYTANTVQYQTYTSAIDKQTTTNTNAHQDLSTDDHHPITTPSSVPRPTPTQPPLLTLTSSSSLPIISSLPHRTLLARHSSHDPTHVQTRSECRI